MSSRTTSHPISPRIRAERRRGGRCACVMPLKSNFGSVLDISQGGARTRCGWRGLLCRPGNHVRLLLSSPDGRLEVGARAVHICRNKGHREARFELLNLGDRQVALLKHMAGVTTMEGAVEQLAKYRG